MANTTNFGWETPDDTDLVKDGAAAMRTLGNAIDASLVDLKGGTTGQVLSKNTNTDMDFTWVTSDDANAIQNTIVDAKGDLISASAADVPARLAVGNNGETLLADSSTSTGLRWQTVKTGNVLTNANFDIWQRGTSFTGLTASTYTADRWTCAIAATGENVTVTQDTSVPNSNSKYSIKYVQTANATSVTALHTRQFIEQTNVLKLLGKSCILSFWYRSNKTGSHGVRIYGAYNTGGTDQATTFTVNVADTWEYKTVAVTAFSAVTAPSANPTDAGGIVDIGFRVEGAGFTTLSANDYFQVSQVQLEAGSVATAFQTATGTLAGELQAAQRYYWRTTATTSATAAQGFGAAASTTSAGILVTYPTTMRAEPTSLDYSTLELGDSVNAASAVTSLSMDSSQTTERTAWLSAGVASGLTQYRPYSLRGANNTASYLGFSAEL